MRSDLNVPSNPNLAHPCPRCGAKAGERCRSLARGYNTMMYIHRDRRVLQGDAA